jgi:hypothetical protein
MIKWISYYRPKQEQKRYQKDVGREGRGCLL